MSETFVVVGGGLAGAKAVEELRSAGFEGDVVVYGDEHHLPYERPPLSKGYLLGQRRARDGVRARPRLVRRATTSTCGSGTAVTAIDPAGHVVRTRDAAAVLRPAAARDRLVPAAPADGRRLRRAGGLPPHHRGQPAAQGGASPTAPAS